MIELLFSLWLVGFSIAYGIVIVIHDNDSKTNEYMKFVMAMCSWFIIGIILGIHFKRNDP